MKVLLIRFSSLGDVVLATAAVEALREDRPEAEVHILSKPGFREVFRDHPGVHAVLPWDLSEGLVALGRRVRDERYDWIIDLHGNLRSRALRILVPRARWRRYRKGAALRRLAVVLRRAGLLADRHVVDRYLATLAPLGVGPHRRLPRLFPGDRAQDRARAALRDQGWDGRTPLVALAPGARWATKAWPVASWVDLTRHIVDNRLAFPVLVGGGDEHDRCREVLSAAGGRGGNLAGQTSILETAAVLQQCAVLVTNDSAPLHLATAVRTPVVALFGPTVPGFGFRPLGERDVLLDTELPCRPCSLHGDDRCPEGHHRCLEAISTRTVVEAVTRVLDPALREKRP